MIEGILITPLKKIPDERGTIIHMLRSDSAHFRKFGEIYFSTAYPGVVKAWHLHKKMTLNYAVIRGMIKLVLFDGRKTSKTKGELQEIFIGDQNYCLVTVPPGVWNGFKNIGVDECVLANCATHPHEKEEIIYLDPLQNDIIQYDWTLKIK